MKNLTQMMVQDVETASALLHPTRSRILAELREPRSATEVARLLGLPPARVGHHVKRLREAGLVRRAASRRIRNLTETLWLAHARTFVIAERLTPGGEKRAQLRADGSRRGLRNLVAVGERLAGDALALLDEAACDDAEFSTFATSVDLNFPDARSRAAFLTDLLAAVRSLREKYGADAGTEERYSTVIACYPQ